MTELRTSRLREYVRGSWRILLKELGAFGVVGGLAFVLDFGIFTLLAHYGALKANIVSTVVSTTFAWFGNRHWSFSHRARTSIGRETSYFFGINLLTLAFSEALIAVFVYGFDYGHGSVMIKAVKFVTIGIGTVFRFWAYKRFVFLHPEKVHPTSVELDSELAE